MDDLGKCRNCAKLVPSALNYCSWDCQIADAVASGAVRHTPNGLPVQCVTGDGLLLECEHGDHADYLFPVTVEGTNVDPECPEYPQTHALIYTDGAVALTLYECCYAIYSVHNGRCLGGHYGGDSERLSEASLAEIRARLAKDGG